ncbi:MAG: Fic family protein [Synechococcus sp.]|jgi:death-on-curing protein|nr:Fic family protein [Synechococcus sp.]
MRRLNLAEVLDLHHQWIAQSGGSPGIRDPGLLEALLGQPWQTFGGVDLYPEFLQKVACLGFSLIQNHFFIDGKLRIGPAAMEVVMVLNGVELVADVDESEAVVLRIATSVLDREGLARWLAKHQVS